jgi:hypothetical protein
MRKSFIWAALLFVVGVAFALPQTAAAQSCAYRYSQAAINSVAGRTFDDIMASGYNYQWSLRNNWDRYNSITTANPPSNAAPWHLNYRYERSGYTLAQYYQKVHATQANEAVIVLHGSSVGPDFWFFRPPADTWADTYLNGGGIDLYNDGFDVYAPYVTHAETDAAPWSRASGRVATGAGARFGDLDIERAGLVYDALVAKGYSKIHIVGISYGGAIAVGLRKAKEGSNKLGLTLAIEGWLPARAHTGSWSNLTAGNMEVVFQVGITQAQFAALPSETYVAYGSCNAASYTPHYGIFTSDQVITYTGAHEFLKSVWDAALYRHLN